ADSEEQNVSTGLSPSSNVLGESNKGNILSGSNAGGAGVDAAGKQARRARFSEKFVEARTRELIDVLDSLRTAGEANLESLALSNESIREDGVDCGDDRQWRLKEEGKEHRVLYRKGPEGTPLHEICLEGIIHGPLDTLLAVVWEVPFFKDWWPQFSVPPFKVLESKFAHRIAPGLELSYLQFKSPWPFATRELLFFAFMVHDTATGLFVASVHSPPDDISHMDPETAPLHPSAMPAVAPGCVRMTVGGGFAGQDLGGGRCYFRGACTLDMKFDLMPPWLINATTPSLVASHATPLSPPPPHSGACTLDMKFDLMPPWLINFVARQLAGTGYHLLCHEVDTIVKAAAAAATVNKCDKKKGRGAFQQLLASDPAILFVRARAAAAAAAEAGPSDPQGDAKHEKHVTSMTAATGTKREAFSCSPSQQDGFQEEVVLGDGETGNNALSSSSVGPVKSAARPVTVTGESGGSDEDTALGCLDNAMALAEGIDLLDQALEEPTWKDLDKVTALISKQLDVKNGSAAGAAGAGGSSNSVADYWAAETVKLLEDLKSVSVEALATTDPADRNAWKMCEEGPEHRAMLRKGPEGTAINALCMEGRIDSPVHAAVAMTRDAGFFKEWWPQGDMPVYRIVENRYLARVGDGFDITYMKFKVPWPFPWQEFAMIFFTIYDSDTGVATTVVRTLPEDNSEIDASIHGFSRDMAPPVPSGMVRMAINGGFSIKDLGRSRCHFRSIFTCDLKLPAMVVNFVTKEFGGVLFNLFRKEVETDLADEGQKGVEFRKVLKEEKLYGRIEAAMDEYRAKAAGGLGMGENGLGETGVEGEEGEEVEEEKKVLVATASFVEGAPTEAHRSAMAAASAAAATAAAARVTHTNGGEEEEEEEEVFEDAEDQLLVTLDDSEPASYPHQQKHPHPPVPPAYAPFSSQDPAIAAAFAAAAALAGAGGTGAGGNPVAGSASSGAAEPALTPDVLQAMATLEQALESLRARTSAALSAAAHAGGPGGGMFPGQYGHAYPPPPLPAYGAVPGYGPVVGGKGGRFVGAPVGNPPLLPYYTAPFPPNEMQRFAGPVPVVGRMDGYGRVSGRRANGARGGGGRYKGEGGVMVAPGKGGMGGMSGRGGGEGGGGGKMSRNGKQQPPFHPSQQQMMVSGKAGAGTGKVATAEAPATAAAAPPATGSTLWSAASALFGLATCCTATGLRNAEAAGYILPEELPSERWRDDVEDDYNEYDSEEDEDEGYYEGYGGGINGVPGGYGNGGYGNGAYGPGAYGDGGYGGNSGGRLVDERQVWRGRAMVGSGGGGGGGREWRPRGGGGGGRGRGGGRRGGGGAYVGDSWGDGAGTGRGGTGGGGRGGRGDGDASGWGGGGRGGRGGGGGRHGGGDQRGWWGDGGGGRHGRGGGFGGRWGGGGGRGGRNYQQQAEQQQGEQQAEQQQGEQQAEQQQGEQQAEQQQGEQQAEQQQGEQQAEQQAHHSAHGQQIQQSQLVDGQNLDATGSAGILGSAPLAPSVPPGFEKRTNLVESTAATVAATSATPPAAAAVTAATAGSSGLAVPPGFGPSPSQPSASASPAFPPAPEEEEEPFLSYLPQDEILAGGVSRMGGLDGSLEGGSEGGLVGGSAAGLAGVDSGDTQKMVDRTVERLREMLRLPAKQFWRTVARSPSLVAFLDSYLRFRSRCRLKTRRKPPSLFHLPSCSPTRPPSTPPSPSYPDLLLSMRLFDAPKLMDVAAVFRMTNSVSFPSALLLPLHFPLPPPLHPLRPTQTSFSPCASLMHPSSWTWLLLSLGRPPASLTLSPLFYISLSPTTSTLSSLPSDLLLSMRLFDAPKLMDVCRVLVSQPLFRADLSSSLLQLLRVVEEMVTRACGRMEEPASASEIIEALQYLCDFAFSLDALFDAYPPAPLLLLQATTATTTRTAPTRKSKQGTAAAAAAAPAASSPVRLLSVLAQIRDSFLPLLLLLASSNSSLSAKRTPMQSAATVNVQGKILQTKLEEVAWKYLWGAYLGGRGCARAAAAAAAAAAVAGGGGTGGDNTAGGDRTSRSRGSRNRGSNSGSSSDGLPPCPVCDCGVKPGRGKQSGCPLWDGLLGQKMNFGQVLLEEILAVHGVSSGSTGSKDVDGVAWIPLLRAVDASFGLRSAIYEEKMKGKLPLDNTQFDTISDIIGPPITLPPPLTSVFVLFSSVFPAGKLPLDNTQFDTISDIIGPPITLPPPLTSSSSSDPSTTSNTTAANHPPSAEDFPSLTPSLSASADAESAALEQSKISLVRDIFPDFGEGFVGACLEAYGGDAEAVIQHVLEGSLHPDLAKLDTQLKVKPGKAGAGGKGDAAAASGAVGAAGAVSAAGGGAASGAAGKGKGKAVVAEGGEEDEEDEEGGARGWGGVVDQQREVERKLRGEGSSAVGEGGSSWAGIAKTTTTPTTAPATAAATAAASAAAPAGRFVRSKREDESVEEEVWKRGSAAGTGSRREQEAVKRFVFESQFEYDDEYDDSFDELEGYDVAGGAGSSEVEEVGTRFAARAAAGGAGGAGGAAGAGGAVGAGLKGQQVQQQGLVQAQAQSQSQSQQAQAQAQAQGPQFYVKDGKNYSYKVKGSVAVGSAAQAAEMKRIEAGLIHGLGEGGNRAAWGGAEEEEEVEEEEEEEEEEEGEGGSGGGGLGASGGGLGGGRGGIGPGGGGRGWRGGRGGRGGGGGGRGGGGRGGRAGRGGGRGGGSGRGWGGQEGSGSRGDGAAAAAGGGSGSSGGGGRGQSSSAGGSRGGSSGGSGGGSFARPTAASTTSSKHVSSGAAVGAAARGAGGAAGSAAGSAGAGAGDMGKKERKPSQKAGPGYGGFRGGR
ncbi:unnamed protein product, partial [Closterium sp. NIES-65]